MKNLLIVIAAGVSIGLLTAEDAAARGFAGGFRGGGGFHAGGGNLGGSFRGGNLGGGSLDRGGFGGGGLGGGSLNRGGFGGGNFNRGDLGAGGFGGAINRGELGGGSSLRGGGFGVGGFDRSGFQNFSSRTAPNRSQLNQFLGMPSDAGLHSLSTTHSFDGYSVQHGAAYGPRGGFAHGSVVTGPQGGQVAHGGAYGPHGAAARGSVIDGPQGGQVAHGAVRGPAGNVAHGSAWHGAYNNGYVGVHGGFYHVSPANRYNQAVVIRNGFHGWSCYTPGWYRRYPGAWYAAGWAAGYAWRAATWPAVYGWFDEPSLAPVYYDYGTNVVYDNDNVYVNGEDAGTSDEYYNQANQLATAGTEAKVSKEGDWLPLGVFAVAHEDNTKTNMVMQLAVNKAGIIRGNYTDTTSGSTQTIHGSVDKQTQRAAWTIGDNTMTVIETGLYNLTKDEAPALVHFGKERTEQWLLVRITQDDKPESGAGGE